MLCLLPSPSGKLGRDSLPELSNHFSVSLDYGPESPLNVDQISFNNLKEKVEIAISGEEGGVTGGQGEQSTDIVFHLTAGKDVAKPDVSFEAMVGQSSRGVSVCGREGMVGHSSRGVSVCVGHYCNYNQACMYRYVHVQSRLLFVVYLCIG